ncbi:hypothetical protein E2C01_029154 [Portunus trituberculatus]|uniref:Uncharacterized protein n=1 Tax=Portunus trituberculatus TaxID=210409 RepID=A0A5B7EML3_PORTR|nr:hypothetical protein [Portunus trituberculatus]
MDATTSDPRVSSSFKSTRVRCNPSTCCPSSTEDATPSPHCTEPLVHQKKGCVTHFDLLHLFQQLVNLTLQPLVLLNYCFFSLLPSHFPLNAPAQRSWASPAEMCSTSTTPSPSPPSLGGKSCSLSGRSHVSYKSGWSYTWTGQHTALPSPTTTTSTHPNTDKLRGEVVGCLLKP